ncbi:uncharacterized protein V1516DRAFT_624531 [Lipomyces oligophaga]|uniref:uncharacterized protein n=1 Tax=Lipomyces oligophaga TaxID=45792 RepID=UPI0034CF41DF
MDFAQVVRPVDILDSHDPTLVTSNDNGLLPPLIDNHTTSIEVTDHRLSVSNSVNSVSVPQSPSFTHTMATPLLMNDDEDRELDDELSAHFDFDSAASMVHNFDEVNIPFSHLGRTSASGDSGISIRGSDSDSSANQSRNYSGHSSTSFNKPPPSVSLIGIERSSLESVRRSPVQMQSATLGLPRDSTPPHHYSTDSTTPPSSTATSLKADEDESAYFKPDGWIPPEVMPDFNPLDWRSTNTPYQLSVITDTSKSRVETQIKATLSFRPSPTQTRLHLPSTTMAKARHQLRDPHEPNAQVLELDAIVVCDHNRYKYISVCTSCMNREHKRASRKKQPTPDDTQWLEKQDNRGIMFNCNEILDIADNQNPDESLCSTSYSEEVKNVVIPIRIPCYCRHHNEKIGFRVYFVVKDYEGNVIARSFTEPIMITDDHKTSNANARRKVAPTAFSGQSTGNISDNSESPNNDSALSESLNPRKRKISSRSNSKSESSNGNSYDIASEVNKRFGASQSSHSQTRQPAQRNQSIQQQQRGGAGAYYRRYDETNFNLRSHNVESFGFPDFGSATPLTRQQRSPPSAGIRIAPPSTSSHATTPVSHAASPPSAANTPDSNISGHSAASSALMFGANGFAVVGAGQQVLSTESKPLIQRLVPHEGPTRGGIEVIIVGSGFREGIQINFGLHPATKVEVLSDSTISTILPPATSTGAVVVSLIGIEGSVEQDLNPKIFTYVDDSDRRMMELALQILNYRVRGQLDDARSIAARIMNNPNGDVGFDQSMMNTKNASNMKPMELKELERTLLKCIDLAECTDSPYEMALDLQNKNGQTMLHLAATIGFQSLVSALICREASVSIRDASGYTPLHCAVMQGHTEIVRRLLSTGADPLIATYGNSNAIDLAPNLEIEALLRRRVSEARYFSRGLSMRAARPIIPDDSSDWYSSSGPSSPAQSLSDEFDEPLEDNSPSLANEAKEQGSFQNERPSWSRRRFFGAGKAEKKSVESSESDSGSNTDNERTNAKQLQLRVAALLAAFQAQTMTLMQPNWESANHFINDTLTSIRPTLASIANNINNIPVQRKRANEIVQFAFEKSKLSEYIAMAKGETRAAPPSYEEIYPETGSLENTAVDGKESEKIAESSISAPDNEDILAKINKNKTKMRNDLMLFAFWLPVLLVIVIYGAMNMFGVQISDYVPIPEKLVQFLAARQRSSPLFARDNSVFQTVD